MSKLNQDQELMRNILAKEWHTLYAEEIILVMNYAKEQQAIIDDLIYKAKLRESDHRALLVKYQATKKCWEDVGGKCEELKAQLNNMEVCYIQVKKERDEAVGKVGELGNLLDKALEELDEVSGSNLDRGDND